MKPVRILLGTCSVAAAATVLTASGATGVIPVSSTSPSEVAALMASGQRQPSTAPSLLDRSMRATLRLANSAQDAGNLN